MVSVFFGVLFLVGGFAMAWYRREFIGQLRSIMVSTGQRDPGDSHMRKMEWMAAGIGTTFALSGFLMLVGALDLFSS